MKSNLVSVTCSVKIIANDLEKFTEPKCSKEMDRRSDNLSNRSFALGSMYIQNI